MNKILYCLPIILLFLLISCQKEKDQTIIDKQAFLLGTNLHIRIYEGGTEAILDSVFDEVEKIESLMSTSTKDYDSSEIIDINRKSDLIARDEVGQYTVSPDTARVVDVAIAVAERTQGGFDPTIEPIVKLWGFGTDSTVVPTGNQISRLLPRVDWRTVALDLTTHTLTMRGMQHIDVGGIAKGYAADITSTMMKEAGVKSAILDFGGNIIVLGQKANKEAWRIGIQEPFKEVGVPVLIISTEEISVVTSGVYERYFEDEEGRLYSHLIDPATGMQPKHDLYSVTVLHQDSMIADGFATGLFILGTEKGLDIVEGYPGMEAIFITDKKEIYVSSGLNYSDLELKNKEYILR